MFILKTFKSKNTYERAVLNSPSKYSTQLKEILKVEGGMKECIQHPGEVMFLPSLWWHATENLDDVVIAVGMQSKYLDTTALSTTCNQNDLNQCVYFNKVKQVNVIQI